MAMTDTDTLTMSQRGSQPWTIFYGKSVSYRQSDVPRGAARISFESMPKD
jgi:hypothetical protein